MIQSMKDQHEKWLHEVTALPTAAGREDRVLRWVRDWAKRRKTVAVKRDEHGNLLLQRKGVRGRSPIVLTAHADHPAFVVDRVLDSQDIEAEFRGGVMDAYFVAGPPQVLLHHKKGVTRGVISAFRPATGDKFKGAQIDLDEPCNPRIGDIVTWSVGRPRVWEDMFESPICDDLAGLVAALAAFDRSLKSRANRKPDVRVLVTRAEEIGFIGAIGACKSGLIPQAARVINLECSKSFADSPIGEGPIVRVGDRTSTFDPQLTYAISRIAENLAGSEKQFRFQRKLMPGGTCEASAFQIYGYTAACICLPLGNYHNMNEDTGFIDAEYISLHDFHNLVRLLIEVGKRLSEDTGPSLRARLDDLFESRASVLAT